MRSIWNGHLVLDLPGMGGLPIQLGSANEDTSIHFKTLHSKVDGKTGKELCGTPVKQQYWCPTCEVVVGKDDPTLKGYELEKPTKTSPGKYLHLSEYDLGALDLISDKTITVREFVSTVDPLHFDKHYYLMPPEHASHQSFYGVLRDTMWETGMTGIAQFTMREREHLCAIWPTAFALMLTTLKYREEVRQPDFKCPGHTDEDAREVMRLAIGLLSKPALDWNEYQDNHRIATMEVINAKLAGDTYMAVKPKAVPELDPEEWLENLKQSVKEIAARK